MQAAFVAKEWVDHALSKTCKAKDKLESSEKAHADSEKRLKNTLFHLTEVEKSCKNVESSLFDFEK